MAVRRYYFPSLRLYLTERQFDEMKRLCRVRAISGLEFERRARRISRRLTRALAYAVCSKIEEGNYYVVITWYKVLAVLTTTYKGGKERHLEARMLIDCPYYVERTRDFDEFCYWCLEKFFELNGYEAYIAKAKVHYGREKVNEFEDREDREADLYIEIYDYNYARYPYECEIKLSPYYWTDYGKAKREFVRKVKANIIHKTHTAEERVSKIEAMVVKYFGYDEERFEGV